MILIINIMKNTILNINDIKKSDDKYSFNMFFIIGLIFNLLILEPVPKPLR